MSKVAIIGVGQSIFYRQYSGNIRELVYESYEEALKDANITFKEIDGSIVCSAPEYDLQRSPSGILAEYLNLNPHPTFYVETLCSSGSTGLRLAYSLIDSGLQEVVAVIGFQKMSEISSIESQERMGRGADIQWESPFGTMMPAYYAMYAKVYMDKYGLSLKDLAKIRVKASKYGRLNDKAVYRKSVELDDLSDIKNIMSKEVSSPLRVGDCCANADGSSCLIVANEEKSKKLCKNPVWVRGVGAATESVNLTNRSLYSGLSAARTAAKRAYKMAGMTPEDIDVAEVHDCFTIAEIMAYEDLGFIGEGLSKELIDSKATYLEGKIPVNLDGGLLSKGHPIGATGGSQIRTIVLQLRGDAKEIQVPNAKVGLIHNIGGVGVYANVTILTI